MKKLIAVLAVTGLLVACNDNSGRTERSAADTSVTVPVAPADTTIVTPDTTATNADTTAKPAAH